MLQINKAFDLLHAGELYNFTQCMHPVRLAHDSSGTVHHPMFMHLRVLSGFVADLDWDRCRRGAACGLDFRARSRSGRHSKVTQLPATRMCPLLRFTIPTGSELQRRSTKYSSWNLGGCRAGAGLGALLISLQWDHIGHGGVLWLLAVFTHCTILQIVEKLCSRNRSTVTNSRNIWHVLTRGGHKSYADKHRKIVRQDTISPVLFSASRKMLTALLPVSHIIIVPASQLASCRCAGTCVAPTVVCHTLHALTVSWHRRPCERCPLVASHQCARHQGDVSIWLLLAGHEVAVGCRACTSTPSICT